MPRMIEFQDAVYEGAGINNEMKLNVNYRPKPLRLTGIMINLGEKIRETSEIMDLISKNVDIVCLNVCYKDLKCQEKMVNNLRNGIECLSSRPGLAFNPPAIAFDLPGPDLQIRDMNTLERTVRLSAGHQLNIFIQENTERIGDGKEIGYFGVCCPELPTIMLDRKSGYVEIDKIEKECVHHVSPKEELDEKYEEAIKLALDLHIDFLIISHVENSKTVSDMKIRVRKLGSRPICILAKISSPQELEKFDEILKASDGILIDRESLQIGIPVEKLVPTQKSMIAKCNEVGKAVLVTYRVADDNSTKLKLESVTNAVLEGIDTIFLASPIFDLKNTIKVFEDIELVLRKAEAARWHRQILQYSSYKRTIPLDPTHGMAIAAVEMSMKLNASGIIVTTTTGRTAMLLSIYRPSCPIAAVTRYGITARWLRLYFGVHPIHYKCSPDPDWNQDLDCRVERAMNYLRQWKYIDTGDPVIVVSGWRRDHSFTHSIRLVYAPPAALSKKSDDFEDTWS
ncbi:pyruvate kinase PKM-like isoform X2 [Fopius arisanus]|uniref:Pyruvate kinase n=1 Tax=Fopius arisanus TaxID=64838 RepID=A0A9R1TAM8_9HYME|nr:PREDICTED: pyruvate kinase PKM-like isoform X2 [Fopius arisanus]